MSLVRDEYGLGKPELCTETNCQDPKAVVDGVAVAGLVGILRQLGDLSEFAAEVFHRIQEQVSITSSRIHTLGECIHNIEAALPPLEKAIMAQRSHLHFAYTSGSRWHIRPKTEQNHFVYSDLPLSLMDSYEDCHDAPGLHKLDKFDTGGRGSCFKRYSDPTYFERASAGPYGIHLQSVPTEKKARRSKKKRSSSRCRDRTHDAPTFTHGRRMDFASRNSNGKPSPSLDASTIHVAPNPRTEPEVEDRLTLVDSRNGSGYIEHVFSPSHPTHSEENETNEPSSYSKVQQSDSLDLASLHENCGVSDEELTSRVDLIDFDFHDERLAISVDDVCCQIKPMCSPEPKQISHESHISVDEPESDLPENSDVAVSGGPTGVANPVMFWTNGGLLGLAPSKPPDFGSPTIKPDFAAEIKDNSSQNNGISSSRIFEFSNRLLVNGFRTQISLVGDENLVDSMHTHVPQRAFEEQFGSESPPLQHMTISFKPINCFETSKLKLKFPDESITLFPLFQLVPESAISLHESGLESDDNDDDIFCRSSRYASESESEQWDSGDSPGILDSELSEARNHGITRNCLLEIPNFR